MRLLLDTHYVIEAIDGVQYGLSETSILEEALNDGRAIASAVSLWEAEIKARTGKLPLLHGVRSWPKLLEEANIELLSLSAQHIQADIGPEPENKDPFDRILLGVAAAEHCRLLTNDRYLRKHPLAWRSFPL